MENKTQNDLIRQHLESGKTITPLVALNMFGCLRLGARIHNLKKMGMAIHSRMVGDNGKHYAEYSLPSDPSAYDLFKGENRLVKIEKQRQPSELHASDRYAVAEEMRAAGKMVVIVVMLSGCLSCSTMKPGSAALHRAVRIEQQSQRTEHCRPACKDPVRMYRNQMRSNAKMTRIPFTQLYIF